MAGNRQHILPRFLLKGFASQTRGDKVTTWAYRKGGLPFETTVENISVEKYFYGKEGELSADAEITQLEGNFASLISALRCTNITAQVFNPEIADFVAHLGVRTKLLRESFRESSEYLIDRIIDHLGSEEYLRDLLGKPEVIRTGLDSAMQDLPVEPWLKDLLVSIVEFNAPSLLEEQVPILQMAFRSLATDVKGKIPNSVKEGHIKALAKTPIPEPRVEKYARLNWFVYVAQQPLILGDTGCVFETEGERRFKPIDDKDDVISNVFLPISSNQIVIVTRRTTVPLVEPKLLNEVSSRCSYEYFVCSQVSSDNDHLATQIGSWSGILSKKELVQLSDEILGDIRQGS